LSFKTGLNAGFPVSKMIFGLLLFVHLQIIFLPVAGGLFVGLTMNYPHCENMMKRTFVGLKF
jgi:hypothetical protein